VWHHASIVPLFSFYLSSGRGGGFIAALPLWNSLIHMVSTTLALLRWCQGLTRMNGWRS
jgi:hypothetical protein